MAIRLRFLEPLLAFVLTATLFGSCVAHAQVVQPTYVRPSKGSNIQVFSGTAPLVFELSPVIFDFTAFAAMQITVTSVGGTFSSCTTNPQIIASGSLTKDGNFSDLFVENGNFIYYAFAAPAGVGGATVTYTINSVMPYVRFRWQAFNTFGGINPCTFTVTMTPLPFQTKQASVKPLARRVLNLQTINIPASPADLAISSLLTQNYDLSYARIQNLGVFPVICVIGGVPSAANASFVLAPGVAAADGKGGVFEYAEPSTFASTRCTSVGGASTAAALAFQTSPF